MFVRLRSSCYHMTDRRAVKVMQNDGDFVNVSCYSIIGQERTRTLDSYMTL